MLFRSWALAGNVPCLLSPGKRDTLKKGLLTIISNPFLIQRSSALLKQGRAALLTPSGSCGPWHGGGPALCGRSWCSYAAGNHARGCADASWAGKYASFFIPPVKIPVWAVSWLNPYRGSLAVLDYTRYKGPLSRVFRNFIRRNVELWFSSGPSPIFGGPFCGNPPFLFGISVRPRRATSRQAGTPGQGTPPQSFPFCAREKKNFPYFIIIGCCFAPLFVVYCM